MVRIGNFVTRSGRGFVGGREFGGVVITQEFQPDRTLVENIARQRERLMGRVIDAASVAALAAEITMRKNAQWEDQPDVGPVPPGRDQRVHEPPRYPGPHARQGLFATAFRQGDVVTIAAGFEPEVIHVAENTTFEYGAALEDKFPIIRPTLESDTLQNLIALIQGGARSLGLSGNVNKRLTRR